jgi:ectoine hydroxylase-related dioxygenase (phytanoyl-CoA dioxygenase family)
MPVREGRISETDVETFRRDGAVVLRRLLSDEWMGLLRRGYDDVADDVPDTNADLKRDGRRNLMREGNVFSSVHVARFLRESPLAGAAAAAMGSQEVRLYQDLLFVKEIGDEGSPTPWHQDLSHWPLKGWQMCSIWVSIEATAARTGAMAMVAGSHKGPLYTLSKGTVPAIYHDLIREEEGGPLPDPSADPARFDVRYYETEPGDAVLFHPAMLHSAPGMAVTTPRRTFTFRMMGDDVRWSPRATTYQAHIRALPLREGDAVVADCFPVIWPAIAQTL